MIHFLREGHISIPTPLAKKAMDMQQKLIQHRYHFTIAILASLIIALLSYVAPRLPTILTYFWPLFVSTTVFLVAIMAFGGFSQLATDAHGEKAGEGLLDYVAAFRPEYTDQEPQKFE
ncbi:uncharacterized protein LOC111281094 [Durio zibethinus]|uniref:Uncharacterized protein LOC111281094 n=1 Tax=Durio zibethinus TaxID=66656 RepID=A0A6P5X7N9_DURZI|nr:uncharacterized protein LOC111281094 [Durio zibethinus]